MGLFPKELKVNVLDRVMGFRSKFPGHKIGGQKFCGMLEVMGLYGYRIMQVRLYLCTVSQCGCISAPPVVVRAQSRNG